MKKKMADRTIEEVYESMDESFTDAVLRGISGEIGGHDYYGGKGLGDVEPEAAAKVRRKTSRPKPKRKSKRKR